MAAQPISAERASEPPARLRPRPVEQRTWAEFASALARKNIIKGDLLSAANATAQGKPRRLLELLEITELSPAAFADEVAQFYELERIDLKEMLAAISLAPRFSRPFMREMSVFPFQTEAGNSLAIADPTNRAGIRAAELVLRSSVSLRIASFDDIAAALAERLDDSAASDEITATRFEDSEDVENLRDLASGAPVVRAVNELLEQAAETRATDIHIEPY